MQSQKIKVRLILALGAAAALGALSALPGQSSPDLAHSLLQIALAALLGSGLGALLATRLLAPIEQATRQAEQGLSSLLYAHSAASNHPAALLETLDELQHTQQSCLQDLQQLALALGRGEFDTRIERSYPGLFGQTCISLNTLALQLGEQALRQRQAQQDLQQTIDALSQDKATLQFELDEQRQRNTRALALTEALRSCPPSAEAALSSQLDRLAQGAGEIARHAERSFVTLQENLASLGAQIEHLKTQLDTLEATMLQLQDLATHTALEAAQQSSAALPAQLARTAQQARSGYQQSLRLLSNLQAAWHALNSQARRTAPNLRAVADISERTSTLLAAETTRLPATSKGAGHFEQLLQQLEATFQPTASPLTRPLTSAPHSPSHWPDFGHPAPSPPTSSRTPNHQPTAASPSSASTPSRRPPASAQEDWSEF